MAYSAEAIRNVALVGHRGAGKTSLHEALLFEAGVLTRLGSVVDGTTASDTETDEQARQMSISMTLSSFEWSGRKINLLDTPGEPSFVADALGALRVCESAVFVINAVMGVEVHHPTAVEGRRRARHRPHAVRQHARPRTRRLLPHARVAQGRVRPARRRDRDPDRQRARSAGRHRSGRHARLPLPQGAARGNATEIEIPDAGARTRAGVPREADGRGRRGLRRADGALPRGRRDLARGDRRRAQGAAPTTARSSPSSAASRRATSAPTACSRRSSRTCPSPVEHGAFETDEVTLEPRADRELFAYVFKTRADPFAGPHQPVARLPGHADRTTRSCSIRAPTQGADRPADRLRRQGHRRPPTSSDPATSAASRSSRTLAPGTGWRRATSRSDAHRAPAGTGHGVRDRAEDQGRRGQGLHLAATSAGGGPDDRPAPRSRRPASRSSPACRRSTSR